jgi:hypothetical protein
MNLLLELKHRNNVLFWFGCLNGLTAVVLACCSLVNPIEFGGTNAWYKPIKFALSTIILSWSLGWYWGYLKLGKDLTVTNWVIVITLAFEVLYIAWQASLGKASHYNRSTPFYSFMFNLMALAASIATLAVAYIGIKFCRPIPVKLPNYYLWSIRFGIFLFVIFSFEGFVMGGNLAHTVGGPESSKGLPFINWSLSYGDLRIAHFIGMHALQILPLLAWFVLKNTKLVVLSAVLYFLLATLILVQALRGISIVQSFG